MLPELPVCRHDPSTLNLGANPGARGGLPLSGGEAVMEVLKERALLCGEGAGVHLKDLALV